VKILGVSTTDFANPMMTQTAIGRLLAGIFVFALALVIGASAGQGNIAMLVIITLLAVVALVLFGMQKRAWMLIVFGWLFSGAIYVLPLPFAWRDICVLLAFITCVAYRVLSPETTRQRLMFLDILLLINLGYLGISLVMHPVGVHALGAQTIGGRPYFDLFIAVLAYWVVTRLPDSVKNVSRIPIYILIASIIFGGFNLIAYAFPSVAPNLYLFMGNLDLSAYMRTVSAGRTLSDSELSINRLTGLVPAGQAIVLVLSSYYAPLTLFSPLRKRFYVFITGWAFILAGGFRNILLGSAAAMCLASWFHRRWREMVVLGLAGFIVLALVIAGHGRLYQLPRAAQRALSFLPGDWSPEIKSDAEGSSTWRFELWKQVIRSNLIEDWWFGDGFGADVEKLIATWRQDYNSFAILTGSYHSGPLTAIRYVGIIGTVLFYAFMIAGSVYSYKAVQLARGTGLFPVAVFLAIQLIWQPIHYTFVFGGYNVAFPDLIFQIAILRLVWRLIPQAREEAGLPARESRTEGHSYNTARFPSLLQTQDTQA
jgi:hypothetical protein